MSDSKWTQVHASIIFDNYLTEKDIITDLEIPTGSEKSLKTRVFSDTKQSCFGTVVIIYGALKDYTDINEIKRYIQRVIHINNKNVYVVQSSLIKIEVQLHDKENIIEYLEYSNEKGTILPIQF